MKQFTQLFLQLDRTNKTNEKVELLTSYFLTAPEEDKLWALALFTGRRPPRSIKTAQLHAWALEQTNIPEWLYRESYNSVGDMAETISLLLPANPSASNNSLSEWFHLLASMKNENDEAKKEFILSAWKQFSPHEIFVFNKLIMGSYRIGVSQTLVVRAVSEAVQQEAAVISKFLPDGTVLDGEIICFSNNKPMPFNVLQTRIGRKNITTKILQEAPVVFIAYDILEIGHVDVRNQSQEKRREQLEYLHSQTPSETVFRLSTLHQFTSWDDLKKLHLHSRENVAEGFMIKRKAAQYQTGRKKGDWWKWKIDPLSIDAVLIYAQKGHGRRSEFYSDYTFAVWDNDKLVPFAKAYSGLTDVEIRQVDYFVKQNTLEKFGPVRNVKPSLVFEIGFEGINKSSRHKSGIAVRFPRMMRWRKDKVVADADTLENLKQLLHT